MGLEDYIKERDNDRKKLMLEFKETTATLWVSARRQVFRGHTTDFLIVTDQGFIYIKDLKSGKYIGFACHDLESELIDMPFFPDVCLKFSLHRRRLKLEGIDDILAGLEIFIEVLLDKSVAEGQL